jgi:hypothetical protein
MAAVRNYEQFDLGGATLCVADAAGQVLTWEEPVLTPQQRTRTQKDLALIIVPQHLRAHEAARISLRDVGLEGCNLRACFAGGQIELSGCADFDVGLSPTTAPSTRILSVRGHGTRSCGLVAGRWTFAIPRCVSKILVRQEWAWPVCDKKQEHAHDATEDMTLVDLTDAVPIVMPTVTNAGQSSERFSRFFRWLTHWWR